MVKSMTGYGRAQELLNGYDITVEIKSVNHRYMEFYARLPRAYGFLEEKLKSFFHQRISRGKLEVFVGLNPIETTDKLIQINQPLAQSYLNELTQLGKTLNLANDLGLSHFIRFGDIFTIQQASQDQEELWTLVKKVATSAFNQFLDMRAAEGQRMEEDMLSHLQLLKGYTREIEVRSPQMVREWRNRLEEKLKEILQDKQLDPARLLTEAAIYAEKTAVDEETVRLYSHMEQFLIILKEPDAVGRKLDFLVQEINREINTIGSKAQDVQASKLVVEMKSEVEKIREQIQNIE